MEERGEKSSRRPPRVLQTTPPKCVDCRQYLDDPDLKFFQGDPDDAVRNRPYLGHGVLPGGGRSSNALLSVSSPSWRSPKC